MYDQVEKEWLILSSGFNVTTTPTQVGSVPINCQDFPFINFGYIFTTPASGPGDVRFRFYGRTKQDITDNISYSLTEAKILAGSLTNGFYTRELGPVEIVLSLVTLTASTIYRVSFTIHTLGFPFIIPFIHYTGTNGPVNATNTLKYRRLIGYNRTSFAGGV